MPVDSCIRSDEATEAIPYDRFFSLATEGYHRYGSLFELPVLEEPYAYLANMYRQEYPEGRILDFGCGAQMVLRDAVSCRETDYYGCDSDPTASVHFRTVGEIPQGMDFDMIVANQVLEHLPLNESINLVRQLGRLVKPGGVLLLSVPNPQHPTRHLSNPTHLTPLNYLNLHALVTLAELEPIRCGRSNKNAGPRWFERPLVNMMCRVFRMDWCDTIYIVGRRGTT